MVLKPGPVSESPKVSHSVGMGWGLRSACLIHLQTIMLVPVTHIEDHKPAPPRSPTQTEKTTNCTPRTTAPESSLYMATVLSAHWYAKEEHMTVSSGSPFKNGVIHDRMMVFHHLNNFLKIVKNMM